MSRWYVVIADLEEGPIGSERLKELAAQGIIVPESKVRLESNTEWSQAKNVKGLFFQSINGKTDQQIVSEATDSALGPANRMRNLPPDIPKKPPEAKPLIPEKTRKSVTIPTLLTLILLTHIAPSCDRYEYQIVAPSDVGFDSSMNSYGSQGWEAVTARRATSSSGNASYEIIFKRKSYRIP